ncbi:MAG: hypothetical protein CMA08_01945 [Euryarchaeota archaeon]|nr:hypothetical protein [Euryarchaeota archaeon]DAC35172.1 MAG TPA: DUF4126 domain-containing protein [Candidatus Poseidoniales archaeon]HIH53745.1 DUF4126 domain-containing protein [Candidatus Poseidoniaceae archaeon]
MSGMDLYVALALGVGLAAASGFRVFLPPFLYGLATRFDLNPTVVPDSGMQEWMASDVGLMVLGAAVVCELLAYYIPWLDNLLDTIASPAAVVGGVVLMSTSLGELEPALQWSLSIVVGGTTSGSVQLTTVGVRALSTASTGGLGNPIVSTMEAGACLFCTVLALLLPLIALVLVLGGLGMGGRWVLRRRGAKASDAQVWAPMNPQA